MSEAITNGSVVKRSTEHVATDMDGEMVVLDMKSGMYYGMHEVGALVWNLTEEPKTFYEIRSAVLAEYEIDAERCDRDVRKFLGALAEAGLVEITDEPST